MPLEYSGPGAKNLRVVEKRIQKTGFPPVVEMRFSRQRVFWSARDPSTAF
ncbi:hypothetical protein LptCag_1143 [Leptospirillum ferriphilum]|uniref:Uncharacterized protein n=1 Tax=Leptospirillum ferriphilum TaxID=178606 RepID=A0A094WCY9_9BACT|nr:hypothetical protein LptCag_1143 [Leptospirillum ferriphilum]